MNLLKKAWYRVFQFCFYNASHLLKWRSPVMLTGAGSVLKLPDTVKSFGTDNVLFVTDKVLIELGLPKGLLSELEAKGIAYTLFDGVKANPTIDIVEDALKAYIENDCKGFIAFGGGSVIDTAKAASARAAKPKKTIPNLKGFLKVGKAVPPVFAAPTTAGTGSEVTVAAVITDGSTHHKYAISDPVLIPVCCVLDAGLIVGLPPAITAFTGMDALTHAVEAYITRGVTKRCKKLSEDAARLIFANLKKSYADGSDMEARQNMLLAAFYAGDSFTRAGLTYAHPIAHTLGGLYNEAHGRANAVLLPYVLEAFGASIHKKLSQLARAAGLDVSDKSEEQSALMFIEEIKKLNRDMGIPEKLDYVKREDIPQMTEWALKEANPWYPVPRVFGRAQIADIIEKIIL